MSAGAALLDINVLVALSWPNHVHHAAARTWFDENATAGWATAPPTETGFVRVSSNRAVMREYATPPTALELLRRLTTLAGHAFWPDSIRYVISDQVESARITGHRQVSDAHLLALAIANDGRLVTLDRRIGSLLDPGHPALEVIPTP